MDKEALSTEEVTASREVISSMTQSLKGIIKGKDRVIGDLITAMLAGVNVLLEDVPGTGKTTLAKGLARSISGRFKRIQFTPDLLPSDVLGSSIYNPREGTFSFREGPVFTNILLSDEINRASPRTQSSLLEAMSERQVTIEGTRYPLPDFFMVIATQNPVEFHGTYPLPEAQLDRFGVTLTIGYPDMDCEVEVFDSQREHHPIEDAVPVVDIAGVLKLQKAVRQVKVSRQVAYYIAAMGKFSREDTRLRLGISTRGTLMLYRMAQAHAFSQGRDYAEPDDVKAMAVKTLAHRIVLDTKFKYSGVTKSQVIEEILEKTPVPI